MARYSSRRRLGTVRGPFMRPSANSSMRPYGPPRRPNKYKRGAPLRRGPRVSNRLARSYTFTKTQTKRRSAPVKSHGDNQSASYNSIGKKWLTKFESMMYRKVVSPQAWFQNGSGLFSSTTGKQQASLGLSVLTLSDLQAMKLAANAGVGYSGPIKLFVKSCKSILRLRNQANTNCKLQLYDLVTKYQPQQTTLDDPIECWNKGQTDYGNTNAYQVVGQTPLKSPEFNSMFRVNKLTTVYLEPGQQHDHTVYHQFNRVIDSTRFDNSTSQSLMGLTRFTLIVFHGTLGHESATPSTVTYMPINIDYARSYEFTYGWIETVKKTYAVTDNHATTITDFDFMGESGDVDANITNA